MLIRAYSFITNKIKRSLNMVFLGGINNSNHETVIRTRIIFSEVAYSLKMVTGKCNRSISIFL